MRLGAGIGLSKKGAPGFGLLDIKPVIADEGDHFAFGEEAEFAEHLPRADASSAELLDDIICDALLRRHGRVSGESKGSGDGRG